MSTVWDVHTYDSERRRLVPCFDDFYGAVTEVIARSCPCPPRVLDLGAGTGLLAAAVVARTGASRLCLLDGSAEMLGRAVVRLAAWKPELSVQPLAAELPGGPFDAVISALAIHHLDHGEKRDLFARVLAVLAPGGVFLNAEQVSGSSGRVQAMFEDVHLDEARARGSSEAEIARAVERMRLDRCATVAEQLCWLEEAGFEDADCFFRSFRFAVLGAWRPGGGRPTTG